MPSDLSPLLAGRKARLAVVAFLAVAVAIQMWIGRQHYLDDAFIHLRIAHNLVYHGRYCFNLADPGYATSSPLYTAVLAACSLLTSSSALPKIVNYVVFALLFGLLSWRAVRNPEPVRALLLLGALALFCSPFGLRWLTDGMETGLVAAAAVVLGGSVSRLLEDESLSPPRALGVAALAASAVCLRVEFGYILATMGGAIVASGMPLRRMPGRLLPLVAGGALGYLAILGIFGHILPDTAVAKRSPDAVIMVGRSLYQVVKAHLGASILGVGLLGGWGVTAGLALLTCDRRLRWSVACVNASVPVFFLLLALSAQQIQGIRYFVFVEGFALFANIGLLQRPAWNPRLPGGILVTACVLLIAWAARDAHVCTFIANHRAATYRRFASGEYKFLKNRPGMGYDIGMVGYFTDGRIVDLYGLVNGREAASLTGAARVRRALSGPLDFLFLAKDQYEVVRGEGNMDNWVVVGRFEFPNARLLTDDHLLAVRPGSVDIPPGLAQGTLADAWPPG